MMDPLLTVQMEGIGGWYQGGLREKKKKHVEKGTDSELFGEVNSVGVGDYLKVG